MGGRGGGRLGERWGGVVIIVCFKGKTLLSFLLFRDVILFTLIIGLYNLS